MKINVKTEVKTYTGGIIKVSQDDPSPLTLAVVCITVLNTPLPEDTQNSGLTYQLYTLSFRIQKAVDSEDSEVNLEAYEVELLKSRMEKLSDRVGGPMIVGACWDILEGREEPKL